MTDQTAQEPTMEEILASIRRIISEDDAPAELEEGAPAEAAAPEPEPVVEPAPPAEPEEDVLELSEPAPAEETIGDLDVLTPLSAPDPFPASNDGLVGDAAAGAAAGSFAGLAARLEPAVPEPDTSGGPTIDQLARQLLRPMLKDWLDANLPGIVEAQVRREVERIARNAR